MYEDRKDAGRRLARAVAAAPDLGDAVVLGLTRGGVPVAYEVARAQDLPLDVLIVRKLGAPGQRELAVGAVAWEGTVVLNENIVAAMRISDEFLGRLIAEERREIERQERLYREGMPRLDFDGRTAIIVDDGLATGATMRTAARAVRPRVRRLILAAPVGAESTCKDLEREADLVICPLVPDLLEAVGQFYRDFTATCDDEVRDLLREARQRFSTGSHGSEPPGTL